MTALASARATTDVDLLTLTLLVSSDQKTWHPIVFKGESPAYVDKQAAAWLKGRPDLAVEMDDSTCCGEFPRTFNEMFASIARDRQLVQVQTL
ncbi:hypothetical protein FE633_17595 [Streptomyces montanus]|uniref:Uncharacterized protein n=1 Tax=Streptomyces montanus TaxID=2580423 RepID=A0A5R9FS84_9ACTN|nr:hypothetical protein [Streptomyces montanus]TLS44956.1 hypothetical protein FE633_17595 [Streptomyces montanus]